MVSTPVKSLLDVVLQRIKPGIGLLLSVDGTIEPYNPARADKTYDFKELKDKIGCQYGEIVYLSKDVIMVLDEEGKLLEKEINLSATALYQERFSVNDCIAGDVVICHTKAIR